MTAYDSTPQSVVEMLIPGRPSYAFGSKSPGPICRMIIDHDSVAGNVVTLTVTVVEGNIPLVGDLIYVYATSNSAGALNQTTGIAIAAVSITAATGKGTLTYPKTVANQGNTVDTGYALSTPQEISQTLPNGLKSAAFAIQNTIGRGYGISWSYRCPSAPAAMSVQLEGAISDVDAEYAIIGTALTTTSGAQTFANLPELINFVRLNVTSATGGSSPTIVGKILAA